MARARTALLVAAAAAALALPAAAPASPGPGCFRWASSSGSDGNPGTRGAPFRTIAKLLSALPAGATGCLAAGSQFHEHLVVSRAGHRYAPVRIRTYGSPRAVLHGTVQVTPSGHDFVLAAVAVQGDGSPAPATVLVRGSRTTLVRVAVSGPGYLNRRVACVEVTQGAEHVVLDHAEISTCSRSTTHRSVAPGIVVSHGRGTIIRDSFVFHVPGDGIVLAPDADGTRVLRTIVDGNISGVFIGGGRHVTSSGNLIADSILSFSGKWNVHSLWNGPVGSGNRVVGNCIWRGFRRNLAGGGYAAYGNLVTAPRYANRPASLSLRHGPCFAKRPRPAAYDLTNLGLPWPRLHRFTVHYTLRALPKSVQVVKLNVTGLRPGSQLEFHCVSGCRVDERTLAAGASASSFRLPGLWLSRGAVVDVRERRAGWVGAYARVVVTGLPHGVAIRHACLWPGDQQSSVDCGVFG